MGELHPASDDKVGTKPHASDSTSAVQEKSHDSLESVRQETHGATSRNDSTGTAGGGAKKPEGDVTAADGFGIEGTVTDEGLRPEPAKIEALPSLKQPFDAEKVANEIEAACNGGMMWGAGTDEGRVLNALKNLTPEQIKAVDDKFAELHGPKYASAGQRWGLEQEFKDEMSGSMLDRSLAVLTQKNEIPADKAVDGNEVLRADSGLKVGEMNRVTLGDGRQYDVYVPKNAQMPLPVMMMMHGASNGNDQAEQRVMEKETGLTQIAEQYGMAVVFPYSKSHDAAFGQKPATWNLQGNKNLLDTDKSYDDGQFLDRVVADVNARVLTDENRFGVGGMSDGAKTAQQYALDRPGKFSAVVSQQGTWMDGNKAPEAGSGLPVMLVNSTSDYMLPNDQGEQGWFGEKGRGWMSWIASPVIGGTRDSRPNQQVPTFKSANECSGEALKETLGNLEITGYGADQCAKGEVVQYTIKGGNHAWHDWRNEGGLTAVGMPERDQNMSEETAKFILSHPLKRTM